MLVLDLLSVDFPNVGEREEEQGNEEDEDHNQVLPVFAEEVALIGIVLDIWLWREKHCENPGERKGELDDVVIDFNEVSGYAFPLIGFLIVDTETIVVGGVVGGVRKFELLHLQSLLFFG